MGNCGKWDGEFNSPTDVAVDSANNIYVTEYNNNRVQKFDNMAASSQNGELREVAMANSIHQPALWSILRARFT